MSASRKKTAKRKKTKQPRSELKTSPAELERTIAELRQQLAESLNRERATASEKLQYFEEQQARTRELEALRDISTAASQSLELKPVFEEVAKKISEIFQFNSAGIYLLDSDKQELHLQASFGMQEMGPRAFRRGQGLTGMAVETGQPIVFENVQTDPRYEQLSASKSTRDHDYSFFAIFPIKAKGKFVGSINCLGKTPRKLSSQEIRLITSMSDQIGAAVENINLYAELKGRTAELEHANSQLREALEHQTATSEVLGIISRSKFDLQPVLEAVAQNAARLCAAEQSFIFRLQDGMLNVAAAHNASPELREFVQQNPIVPGRSSTTARAALERQTIHIPDILADPEYSYEAWRVQPHRSVLAVPMLKGDDLLGVITVNRSEMRPFTEKQIELVTTFADQAVIAIENTRLLQELQTRNRDLSEALEQQTATSEVLRVIASSPTEIQPVLDTLIANAVKLSGATQGHIRQYDGELLRPVAHYGESPEQVALLQGTARKPGPENTTGRAFLERKPIHVLDAQLGPRHPGLALRNWARTMLAVPLLREGTPLGVITIWRDFVEAFTERQIGLVQTFADQAVIAIENVRLFQELKESLEQQTATSEILGVIASSPTDIQPVLETVAKNAARLCEATDSQIRLIEGDGNRLVASFGTAPAPEFGHISHKTPTSRAILNRQTVHVHDLAEAAKSEYPDSQALIVRTGTRTFLSTPMLRQGVPVGTINIRRTEVRPFSGRQIKLLETFAAQAVIAIENVRLFKELQERNRDLIEALEQQTATSEILSVIASSPTNIQPVLDVVAQNAARLCDALDAAIYRIDGERIQPVAHCGPVPIGQAHRPLARTLPTGRAILDRATVHIHDLVAVQDTEFPDVKPLQPALPARTCVATPLLREGAAIGVIFIRRTEVRPFTDKQIKLLETFASQAAIAIENVRLFQELEARTRELARSVGELRALGEVGQAVSSTLDLQNVLSTIVRHAVELSQTDGGVVYEYEEATEEFHLRASHLMEAEIVEALKAAPVRPGQGATGRAATLRVPVQLADILKEQEFTGTRVRPMFARLGYRSVLAVPLLREERVLGALTVWRKQAGDFSPEIVNLLQTFATQSALAIQNARLFREIEDKSRQIEAANRHKSEFLANMSHELRTPLTAIIGFSEVLSDKIFGELNDKQDEYMGDIVSSGRHLLSLINDILDLSKVEAGRMELDVTRFDLPTAIENALILIRERATRHGIKLEHHIDERLGEIVGDERKFKQILLNLLSNAVKFTPEGGSIGVSAAVIEEAVEVAVRDTGIGIAAENHQTIFEEFRQVGTDASKKREGTGLGLTLSKKFVELHGGSIRVESAVGKGSTFTFTLPLQR